MNYVQSDTGKSVLAIGAPASIKRVEVQYPMLIMSLRNLRNEDDAIAVLNARGFASKLERESLLFASGYMMDLAYYPRT